ncbi:MAG: response regulator transcription factor [Planctomycetota bacterium]
MKARLLLVEDDVDLARGVRFNLEQEGYEVLGAGEVGAARSLLKEGGIDLVLLDLNLPDGDGLDLLRELREDGRKLPVICLTARGQETDVVMGLTLGADDYVKKPFGVAELLARIEALLRRAGATSGRELRLPGVIVDLEAHTAKCGDREEELTPIEIDVLKYLLEHRGQAVDRQRLLRELWGLSPRHTTRTLDNHVARLRRKLEADPARPKVIVTVHGIGYRLESGETGS